MNVWWAGHGPCSTFSSPSLPSPVCVLVSTVSVVAVRRQCPARGYGYTESPTPTASNGLLEKLCPGCFAGIDKTSPRPVIWGVVCVKRAVHTPLRLLFFKYLAYKFRYKFQPKQTIVRKATLVRTCLLSLPANIALFSWSCSRPIVSPVES